MKQNVFSQYGCRIFQSTISLGQVDEIAWFLTCWYKFTCIKSWPKNVWVGMVRNGCGQSGHRTFKIGCISRMNWRNNWFSACWCKFRKAKSYFNGFWLGLVKKRCGHWMSEWVSGHWMSQWICWMNFWIGWSWFFVCWLWCNNFWLEHLDMCLGFFMEFDH